FDYAGLKATAQFGRMRSSRDEWVDADERFAPRSRLTTNTLQQGDLPHIRTHGASD
ncbi:hypothetical protein PIIN_11034, partial [Serendipita indica DSM 11827]